MKQKLLLFFLLSLGCLMPKAYGQFYSASTNILGLGLAGANLEFSATINRNWSTHMEFSAQPFKIENIRLQHLLFRPQVRYWFQESYRGWFTGLHGIYTAYHIGIKRWMKYKYEGIGYGAGLDIGYALPLSKSWNMEFQLGGSFLQLDYIKSVCQSCGLPISSGKGNYILPTRASVSFVYLF